MSAAKVVPDRKVRHRVLRLLAGMPDPAIDDTPWRRFLSSRGEVRRLWAHPGVLNRLAADPKVSSGGTGAALAGQDGLTADAKELELYVSEANVEDLIHLYRMRDDRNGPVHLVIVPSSVPADLAPQGGRPVPVPAAAADLLEEEDPRARYAGIAELQASLRALQAAGWLDKATARSAQLEAGSQ